jgi:hypothetical protein
MHLQLRDGVFLPIVVQRDINLSEGTNVVLQHIRQAIGPDGFHL